MALSSAVKLDPAALGVSSGLACIKPIPVPPKGEVTEGEIVKISTLDCLACSGCITSAESLLVELQSVESVYTTAKKKESGDQGVRRFIVSIAPQALASIAAHYHCTAIEAQRRVYRLFRHRLGVDAMVDTSFAQSQSNLETAIDFIERFCSSNDTELPESLHKWMSQTNRCVGKEDRGDSNAPPGLPFIVSACPGVVAYAEKKHEGSLVPCLSRAKSPQGIVGTVVKRLAKSEWGVEASEVYHLSIYACYDKKLEAVRPQLKTETGDPETDSVLSSSEIITLIDREYPEGEGWEELGRLPDVEEPPIFSDEVSNLGVSAPIYGASGGYLEFTVRFVAYHLLKQKITEPLQYTPLERGRVQEVKLSSECGDIKFRLGYGFTPLTNLARNLKKKGKVNTAHFYELMACQGGCLNGLGQVKPEQQSSEATPTNEQRRELLRRVEAIYSDEMKRRERLPSGPTPFSLPTSDPERSRPKGGSDRDESPPQHKGLTVAETYRLLEGPTNGLPEEEEKGQGSGGGGWRSMVTSFAVEKIERTVIEEKLDAANSW